MQRPSCDVEHDGRAEVAVETHGSIRRCRAATPRRATPPAPAPSFSSSGVGVASSSSGTALGSRRHHASRGLLDWAGLASRLHSARVRDAFYSSRFVFQVRRRLRWPRRTSGGTAVSAFSSREMAA